MGSLARMSAVVSKAYAGSSWGPRHRGGRLQEQSRQEVLGEIESGLGPDPVSRGHLSGMPSVEVSEELCKPTPDSERS